MLHLSILIITKAIKMIGITSAIYDIYFSLFNEMGINLTLLVYTLTVETLFVYLKSAQIEVPILLEALEDLI
ncbi:MAG: hypothetical protein WBM53_03475 [Maribacter sp.]